MVSYANLQALDVNHFNKLKPSNSFLISGVEKLVSEVYAEVEQIRESSGRGMADESQLLSEYGLSSGSLLDSKKMMVPSIHYHRSLTEVSDFLWNFWNGKTYNKANLSSELTGQPEKLAAFKLIVENTLADIKFTESQLQAIR